MNDTKTTTTKFYTVFSQQLCGELIQQGFVLQDVSRHRDHPDRNVFHFVDSTNLRTAINTYKENNRKKNDND
jgi:hypothetical protein